MRAYVIAVGSELLGTDRLDTNSLRLSASFAAHGVVLVGKSVVGDSYDDLVRHLRHARESADLVVMSGGLGPTTDDLTRETVAAALGLELEEDPAIVAEIEARFRDFGMVMPEINRRQAMVPRGGRPLSNRRGSAPGLHLHQDDTDIFLLPGVPHELDHLVEVHLAPWLCENAPGSSLASRSLRVACRSESAVEEELAPVYERFDADEITVLASPADIEVRFTVTGTPREVDERLAAMVACARGALGRAVYAEGREATLEGVVGEALRRAGRSVVTAESCTGGLVAQRLTAVPGSSDYFLGAVVTYSNELKERLLGVSPGILREHGAVSEEVARAMALGARERLGADFAISATGVAGPGGGTPDKPVGTVHVALAGPGEEVEIVVDHRRLAWKNAPRGRVRHLSSQWGLELLRRRLSPRQASGTGPTES